jgi:hypothetical protein
MFRVLEEPFRLILLIILLGFAFLAKKSHAVPLDPLTTFCTANPTECRKGSVSLLTARGIGTNSYYSLEVDPTTGGLPITDAGGSITIDGSVTVTSSVSPTGRAYADSIRHNYASTNVTTGSWVQIIASTAATINTIIVDDTCGEVMELGTGAAAAEARRMLVPRGGQGVPVDLAIAAGTRVSLRAVTASCTSGDFVLTGLN